ncbi:DUF4335 domain-containing protein [Phormidium sp. LEGE 05292]|uniref:DUF4335 domain-containing protein n=1 Tax=[Phormidium] sp. LEGE 05292 TaxID=767427 RepID=UPI00187DF719|nr:DUF4335 domain-containing protein [Phormidium sp. LEGE 05292]MBE9226703.1 DUF4335 domain-containing protein [Phormidium sp. LEGE 05292]
MTTIQRQYSLPNCTLILEGLSETTGGIIQSDMRPVLSILVNAECRLAGYTGPSLSGGRDFFESLVTAVSSYAQEILSGLPHQHQHLENGHVPLVQLRRNGQNLHRLIIQPHNLNAFSHSASTPTTPTNPIAIDLSTVQLFDLVEAVDQFFADSQTLPSLGLKLAPVEKRFAKSDEDLVKQAAPAALGLSSLALAAIALFFAPIPEVQRPREPLPQENSGVVSPNSTIPGQSTTEPPLPPTTTNTTPQSNLGGQTTTPVTSSTTEVPANSAATPLATQVPPTTTSNLGTQTPPVATPTPEAVPTIPPNSPVAVQSTPAPVAPTVPPTDSTVAVQPTPAPVSTPTPPTDSTVAVQPTPAPETSTAPNSVVQTPVAVPTIPSTESNVGLQTPATTLPTSTPSTSGTQTPLITGATLGRNNEIVDAASLKILNRNLYRQLQQSRTEITKFPEELVYRVAMRPDGTVINYEPRNQPAQEYLNQTPLPNVGVANVPTDSTSVNQQPVAYFKVVFTPKGVLQVSPWRGYQ